MIEEKEKMVEKAPQPEQQVLSNKKEIIENINDSHPKCYFSEKSDEPLDLKTTPKPQEKKEKEIKEENIDIEQSLGFSHLNIEEDNKNDKNVSKVREIETDSDSSDDDQEMGFSEFKIYSNRNEANEEKNNPKEKPKNEKDPLIRSGWKSPLDLKINQNINKSLKHTMNQRDNLIPQSPSACKEYFTINNCRFKEGK